MKENQSEQKIAFIQNAGHEKECQKNILIWRDRVVCLLEAGGHLQCLFLGIIGQESILEDGGIVIRD